MGDLDEVGVVDERRDGHTAEVDVLQHRVRGSVRGRVGVRVGVRVRVRVRVRVSGRTWRAPG